MYPTLLPLMRTPRLPVVDWTDALRRFKWTRPFGRKTKCGFCACAITFQTQSTPYRAANNVSNFSSPVPASTTLPTKLLYRQDKCAPPGNLRPDIFNQFLPPSTHNKSTVIPATPLAPPLRSFLSHIQVCQDISAIWRISRNDAHRLAVWLFLFCLTYLSSVFCFYIFLYFLFYGFCFCMFFYFIIFSFYFCFYFCFYGFYFCFVFIFMVLFFIFVFSFCILWFLVFCFLFILWSYFLFLFILCILMFFDFVVFIFMYYVFHFMDFIVYFIFFISCIFVFCLFYFYLFSF